MNCFRRNLIRKATTALSGLLMLAVSAMARPKNVLLIIADDLRPALGCYSDPVAQTPHIDRLASEGVLFQRAFCPQALCAPSRVALLVGVRPDTSKVTDVWTHFRTALPDVVTLPQLLQRHGWYAQAFGKVYHSNLNDAASWSVPHVMPADPLYGSPATKALLAEKRRRAEAEGLKGVPLARMMRSGPPAEAPDVADEDLVDGKIATLAIEALRANRQRQQPFFLAVGFTKPHLPFVAPKQYWDRYDASKIPLSPYAEQPHGAPSFVVGDSGELYGYHEVPRVGEMSEDYQRWLRHGYLAATSYMDAQVGRVLAELEQLELDDDTLVIFWGDNGYKLGDYAAWTKTTNVQLDTRIPLIIRAPGLAPAGKKAGGMVEVVDVYPTLLELLGFPGSEMLEGTSFLPLLRQPRAHWKEAIFTESPQMMEGRAVLGRSMVTEDFRLTRWYEKDAPGKLLAEELYDLRKDPGETRNVAGDSAYADVIPELRRRLEGGWRHTQTPH